MNATSCLLCHEAPVVAEHKLRGLLDPQQILPVRVCELCHLSLVDHDWLTLVQRMILVRQPRVGARVLAATDELKASQLTTVIDLRHRLTGEYTLLE